jgi:hypothetical protein
MNLFKQVDVFSIRRMIAQGKISFGELHVTVLSFAVIEKRFPVIGPAVLVSVLLTGATSHQENEVMRGRSYHPSLLLPCKPRVNVSPAVIKLFWHE